MTIQIKHAFTSAKGDGGDATQVQPSYWNASHSTSMASGQLIGRLTAGAGAFEEIPISAYMAGLLAAADAAGLAAVLGLFETGDVKYTFRTAASAGWLLMLGGTGSQFSTIGNAVSNAVLVEPFSPVRAVPRAAVMMMSSIARPRAYAPFMA